ncbi:MAG: hypothetical protein HRT95_01660 [Moritella sp.]|uniref:hypothetical protein n=1 Tax=Moritella sp. TaxID=78556 RepID=UPI001DA8ABCB|nr:hypothetical protein [Moritella sp.]NQZ48920.1 hypothetical protein [Moritella sp.]
MKKLTLASLLLTSLSAPMLATAADVATTEHTDAVTSTELTPAESIAKDNTVPVISNELAQAESIAKDNTVPVISNELAQAEPMIQENVPALSNTENTITLASLPTEVDSVTAELSPAELIIQAIAHDPANAQEIIAQAFASMNSVEEMETLLSNILASSADDPLLVQSVAAAMIEAGVDSDTVVALAVAQGIDATLVSEATAAGPESAVGLTVSEVAAARAAGVAAAIAASVSPRKTPKNPGNGGNGGISKNV